ncbi:MAG: IS4 family transposase [Deltaproteobacteria bacterium]|nr:IS4 family transposase [Deltaproteobacteria bacterium]
MNDISTLQKTTFSGRRFTRKQLQQVQETVQTFKNLSRKELALTICEHLNWITPNGKLKVNSALTLLEKLESYGIVTLPAKKKTSPRVRRIPAFVENPECPPINDTLNAIGPVTLQKIISKEDREAWKAYIQTYHYLGYKHPVGAHIGYFIVSEARQQKLGCLLFTASAAWTLAPRDKFIGWEKKHRQKLLHLIISNNRFLIFPWINVPNLASQSLSLATKQIGDDWLDTHGYRPVLIETFVDTTKYSGTCYQAANWQYLGKTQGRGRFDPRHECKQTIKDIYIYPLESAWRYTLTNYHSSASLKKKYRNDIQQSNTRSVGDDFVGLWEKVVKIISEIASQYDELWQVRKRVINSMLIILLIFRLVCSKNSQSYGTTIDELWDSCDKLGLPLPQNGSIAPSSFCTARMKLDETVFKQINQKIISTYAQQSQEKYKWLGHRIFAVDGSKINLPRKLMSSGYKLPSENANYPQGLLSCLYQVKSQMPFDFDLTSHANERICAQHHLHTLEENDIVVYDRGYFSYAMLHQHLDLKIHAVFRLQKSSYTVIRDFFSSHDTDSIVTINPSLDTRREIMLKHPNLEIVPIQMRLIKYQIGDNTYCLGTTLVDQKRYSNTQDFIDIYHARWGVEELYKVSKHVFFIEDFHAKSERGVKQEIFAHFVLITMNRIFANQADSDLNQPNDSTINLTDTKNFSLKSPMHAIKTNFKNCIHVFSRSIEELLLLQTKMSSVVERVYHFIIGRNQKERPGRSYSRKSMRPESKWRPSEKKKKKKISATPPIPAPL